MKYAHLLFLLTVCFFVSCDNESYESGDTDLSYLYADFVMARTAEAKQVVSAVNDDGEQITLDSPLATEWTTTADSTYRALLYYTYNSAEDEKPHGVSLVNVPVLLPKTLAPNEADATDPVGWESAWLSAQQPFLNLSLQMKTGVTEGIDSKQVIGIVDLGSVSNADGTTTHHLSFYHNQNDVPQYYSVRLYVSIPTEDYRSGDTIVLTVNTYNGVVERTFVVSR